MEILDIIPFNKNFKRDTLSYFSTREVPIGSLVTINIRSKATKGIVISKKTIADSKSDIKNLEFNLRKITSFQKNTIINQELIEASKEVAEYFATSTGAVINSVLPKFVLDNINKVKTIIPSSPKDVKDESSASEKYVLQEPDAERYSNYRRLIREAFAKKRSVMFICPTIEDVNYANTKLSKGIEENTYVFHSNLQ